jgi:predicted Rossmann fold nucleotide-binding protein DprA/Smf involved in DNA uptake
MSETSRTRLIVALSIGALVASAASASAVRCLRTVDVCL